VVDQIHAQTGKHDPKAEENQPEKEEVRMALNNLLEISAKIGTLRAVSSFRSSSSLSSSSSILTWFLFWIGIDGINRW
jgi:hypothetical protein